MQRVLKLQHVIQYVGPAISHNGNEYPVWVKTRKGYWKFERPIISGETASGIRLVYQGGLYIFTTKGD